MFCAEVEDSLCIVGNLLCQTFRATGKKKVYTWVLGSNKSQLFLAGLPWLKPTDGQTVRRTGRLGLAAMVFRTAETLSLLRRSLSIDS